MTGVTALPWAAGASTGIGSMPGEDAYDAMRVVLDECPALPYLAELPGRGPGADLIGRGAALLAGLAVDLQPSGWRLVDRAGLDLRQARDLLARDLDALSAAAAGYPGPLKVQAAGPWTLAATLELGRGGKALGDPGARRDLGQSLAEGLRAHLAEIGRRLPGAAVVLQLDEPALPAVLQGRIPTPSGFGTVPAVEEQVVSSALRAVIEVAGAPALVHCCAGAAPIDLIRRAGAAAISLDMSRLTRADDQALGEALEAGVGLLFGLVPGVDAVLSGPAATVAPVRALSRRLGLPAEQVAAAVVVTPSCGLAGASPAYARAALAHCHEAARALAEDPEGSIG